MKKYILGILVSLILVSPVYAYTVKQGDTLWGLFGSKWGQIATINGISDPTKLQVGQELKTEDLLGASIPSTPALIDTYLASAIAKTDTQMTLANGYDRSGAILTGLMCFTLDVNTPSVEYTCGTASGTLVYNLQRGLNLSNPNVTSSALAFSHRRLATVQVTDYPSISILSRMLNGQDALPNHLIYTTTTYTYGANQLVTWDKAKDYTDYVGAGGFTYANVSTTRGLSVDGSVPEKVGINASSTTGMSFDSEGKLYQKVNQNSVFTQDSTGITLKATTTPTSGYIPVSDSSGKIDATWLGYDKLNIQTYLIGENIDASSTPIPVIVSSTGQVYKASTYPSSTSFIGFVPYGTYTSGNYAIVQTGGLVYGFTGLATNTYYYLNAGIVSTTVNGYPIIVGLAINSSQLSLIKNPILSQIYISTPVATSTPALTSADSVTSPASTTYTKTKEILYNDVNGTINVYFELRDSSGSAKTQYARIYKNGVAYGTERSTNSGTYQVYQENLSFNTGDLIQIYQKNADGSNSSQCQNFRLHYIKSAKPITNVVNLGA